MLDVFVSKSVRMLLTFSWEDDVLLLLLFLPLLLLLLIATCSPPFSSLRLTSARLARRWMMGHRSARRPKRVSTDAIAVRSTKSCL